MSRSLLIILSLLISTTSTANNLISINNDIQLIKNNLPITAENKQSINSLLTHIMIRSLTLDIANDEKKRIEGFVSQISQDYPSSKFACDPSLLETVVRKRNSLTIVCVINTNKTSFYSFYYDRLKKDPNLTGTILFKFYLDVNGNPFNLTLESDLAPELISPLIKHFNQLSFGKSLKDDEEYHYKLVFISSDSSPEEL